jgi:hypothetical protein
MTTIRIERDILEIMRAVKEDDGIPMAVQVDKALREWLQRRGRNVKTQGKRAPTRKPRETATR